MDVELIWFNSQRIEMIFIHSGLNLSILRTIFRGHDFILIYADRYHIKQSLTNFHQRKIQKNDE